jgi:hypothetical protein
MTLHATCATQIVDPARLPAEAQRDWKTSACKSRAVGFAVFEYNQWTGRFDRRA